MIQCYGVAFNIFFCNNLNAFICLWMVCGPIIFQSWVMDPCQKPLQYVQMCIILGQYMIPYEVRGKNRCLSLYVCVDDCVWRMKVEGREGNLLSTIICISAAHHYNKVSINHSPCFFIVSPSNVWRLLNKKAFLYGEEGSGGKKKEE